MRCARNEQDVGLYGVTRGRKNPFTIDRLFPMEAGALHQFQPFFDSAAMFTVAVVIEDAFAPGDAKDGVFAARQDYGVFDGYVRLVVVAIQSPCLQLAAREFAFVHQQMEWMFVVIALFAYGVEPGDKFLFTEGVFVLVGFHREMVRPS